MRVIVILCAAVLLAACDEHKQSMRSHAATGRPGANWDNGQRDGQIVMGTNGFGIKMGGMAFGPNGVGLSFGQ